MWRKPSFFAQPLEQGFHPYAKYEQKINPLFGGPSGIGGFFRRNEFESRQYFTSWNIMQYYMSLLKEKHLVEKEFSQKNSYFLTWLSSKTDLASWKSWIVLVVVRFMKLNLDSQIPKVNSNLCLMFCSTKKTGLVM